MSNPSLHLLCFLSGWVVDHFRHRGFQYSAESLSAGFVFSSDDEPDTITQVSHLEFGRAIHRAAHVVRPMALDSRRWFWGLCTLDLCRFPSRLGTRPPPSCTSLNRLLVTAFSPHRLAWRTNRAVEVAPMITQLFPNLGKEDIEHPFSPYPPLHKDLKPTDVGLYLHSSGSTGFPKAIPQRIHTILTWLLARKYEPRLRFGAMAIPPFHFIGFLLQVVYPVYGLLSLSVFPPTVWHETDQPSPATAEDILLHLRRTNANGVVLIPMMLEGMANSLDNIEYLRSFKVVAYSGGPMPKSLGESLVSSGINLQAIYGSTEAGAMTVMQLNRDPTLHWEWLEFGDFVNMRWEPQGDGTYEGQCLTSDVYRPLIENLEDTKGYATSDLFVPHPTLERFWRIVGRKDDVIIHSSGEKTVPALMEGSMTTNSIIQGAVMFGRGHDQAGVLLEPVEELAIDIHDPKQVADFRTRAWPIIEGANVDAPAFSKIFKEMILITSPDKPLPRTAKGTVMRKAALQLYDEEIEALYQTIESNTTGDHITPPESWDKESLQVWLLQQAKDIQSIAHLDSTQDLFEQGFDSLSATFLRLRIAGALRQALHPPDSSLLQNIVYAHPIIEDLANYVANLFLQSEDAEGTKTSPELVEAMIEKYSRGLKQPLERPASIERQPTEHVVLITGTTGNLGSQVLEQLLRRSDVTTIYAFNRSSKSSPPLVRLETRFKDKGLDTRLLQLPKLIHIEGDLAQEHLGLPLDVYTEVQDLVTIVIHAAWRLDFNLTLASFENSIQGTRNLIDCVRAGPHPSRVRFLYTSSITLAQGWDPKRGPYPEEVVDDLNAAILANSGLHATSIRIGQISGGLPNGAWATSDWVPILIKSSLALGALPDAPGTISWLPMDVVAQCILDLAFSFETLPVAVNLVHPRPLLWTDMFSYIRQDLIDILHIKQNALAFVPFHDWVSRLEERSNNISEDNLRKLPAIKVLDFFRKIAYGNKELHANGTKSMESGGLTAFATDKARRFSPTLRGLHELDSRDSQRWIKYWCNLGFFEES
ncbi:hypothetical protein BDQ17DRAFT_1427302 [Cyathus striatus]|nr:hypothetical protein BDQ17DRAFT_1427302 [Cyathus striatus]